MTNTFAYQTFGNGRAWTKESARTIALNAFELQGFVSMNGWAVLPCKDDPYQPIG